MSRRHCHHHRSLTAAALGGLFNGIGWVVVRLLEGAASIAPAYLAREKAVFRRLLGLVGYGDRAPSPAE